MSEVSVSESGPQSNVSSVAFERLDTLVRVTTIRGWVYLATLFVVGAAAVAFALVYRVPTKVNGEGILLIKDDTLSRVRAQATGRLLALHVHLGDQVAPGNVIGEISQDDLKDVIDEAVAKGNDLEREDLELTKFEQQEKETQDLALLRVKQATLRAQDTSLDKLKIAQHVVKSYNRLHNEHYLGEVEMLEAREKLYEIQDDLNKGQSRVAELALEGTKAENSRRRAQLERRLKIKQLETKLTLDRNKLTRTSRIVSKAYGRVAQVLSAPGELVREGSPVVLLHDPKAERATDAARRPSPYQSIIFVPAGLGKKIEVGNKVEVSPATVKREEHGFIVGEVVAVSELPATRLEMEAALEHPELVETFLKPHAPGMLLRVLVKLEEGDVFQPTRGGSPRSVPMNHFRWSSSSGADQPLKTGTMCQAAVVVEKRRLISLILPWTKTLLGTD
jgi:HlyD family secretion protein